MIDRSKDVDDYLATLAEDRRLPLTAMRDAICNNLPAGFVEVMADMPLPFLGFTSRKNFYTSSNHFGLTTS
jgi:hypothetical protein